MKKLLIFLYVMVIIAMAVATIVEKYHGTAFVAEHYYGAWWFISLWAMLTAVAVAWFLHRRVRKLSAVLLHLSFVVILAGALLTHLTSRQGIIHLRLGETTNAYLSTERTDKGVLPLPFTIRLDDFTIDYHEGTNAAADYTSRFTVSDEDGERQGLVSMNNIYSHAGIRLYQSSYDDDLRGSYLSMNSDPWGIPITYLGYALLFTALVWMLFDPKGAYRQLIRTARQGRNVLMIIALCAMGTQVRAQSVPDNERPSASTTQQSSADTPSTASTKAQQSDQSLPPVLPRETADAFGRLFINYNDRICPLQTFALDFTKKLCGKRSYRGLSPEQVLTGFIFWGEAWSNEPVIRMKDGPLRQAKQLPAQCSVNTFFADGTGYLLGPHLREYYQGQNDKFHQEVMKTDDRLQLIMQLRQGKLLQLFPAPTVTDSLRKKTSIVWYSPADHFPETMETERQEYIRNIFTLLNEDAHAARYDRMNEALEKMMRYQRTFGAASIPSSTKTRAERIYNAFPFATVLFMVNLTMGFLLLFFFIWRITKRKGSPLQLPRGGRDSGNGSSSEGKCHSMDNGQLKNNNYSERNVRRLFYRRNLPISLSLVVLALSFLALTVCLALRWIISGTIPMSNGYETMLLMAWMIMLVSFIVCRRFRIILCFGFLMSGFFLLVSHISQMDPQITHIMPVLASPLLTLHVSIIMMAFALLALTFVCGLTALLLAVLKANRTALADLAVLSKLFLYPALTCLGFGIFIGAIWANVSWGTYWSWDPKETWALITFMVYAVAVHERSLRSLQRPLVYHIYVTLAFLTILMTYFGVNYFLGGMHSYA